MKYPYKQKFTLADAADWDSLDLPGLVPKRHGKKYLNGCERRGPKAVKEKTLPNEEKAQSA